MNILKTAFKQRAYDGKWERLALVPDPENYYYYKTDNGETVTITAKKWITIGVYDYLFDLEN